MTDRQKDLLDSWIGKIQDENIPLETRYLYSVHVKKLLETELGLVRKYAEAK